VREVRSTILRMQKKLPVFENETLRKIRGPVRDVELTVRRRWEIVKVVPLLTSYIECQRPRRFGMVTDGGGEKERFGTVRSDG